MESHEAVKAVFCRNCLKIIKRHGECAGGSNLARSRHKANVASSPLDEIQLKMEAISASSAFKSAGRSGQMEAERESEPPQPRKKKLISPNWF